MQDAAFEEMDHERVEETVSSLASNISISPTTGRTAAEIEQLFQLLHGCTVLGRMDEASQIYAALRTIIDDYRGRLPEDPQGLEFFYDWAMLALKMTPESRSSFVCMPLYEELLEALDAAPEAQQHRAVQARTQLMRHLDYWLGKGGNLDALPEEEQDFVKAARDEYDALHDAAVEAADARGDFATVVLLYRDAAQLYLLLKRPNDAITCLKEVVEYLPDTPDYHESDKAETLLQLGRIFVGYGKHDIALRYFKQAHEIFEAAGDEFEVQTAQVEGWMEEANKKLGK